MEQHDHSMHEPEPAPSFWQSRAGFTLIVFLVVAALILPRWAKQGSLRVLQKSAGS